MSACAAREGARPGHTERPAACAPTSTRRPAWYIANLAGKIIRDRNFRDAAAERRDIGTRRRRCKKTTAVCGLPQSLVRRAGGAKQRREQGQAFHPRGPRGRGAEPDAHIPPDAVGGGEQPAARGLAPPPVLLVAWRPVKAGRKPGRVS